MTTIIGTDKQVAWAEDIRRKALAEHAERIAAAVAKGTPAERIAPVEARVARMAEIADARWWIDNGQLPVAERLSRIDWTYQAGPMGSEWRPA